ncbi:pectin lyase-like protein [Aureobasidium pullulans]|uniref:pectinesterase n=1 Tax=Aureobasidium pullulans TaxID=5580 RepID=A0A4S9CCM0_AURPU|nr:pectin lyase-like protein [Aureobasidium pullulans]
MRISFISGLIALASVVVAQNITDVLTTSSSSAASTSSSSSVDLSATSVASSTSSLAQPTSSAASSSVTAFTVAIDGSAQFTGINAAIAAAQSSGVPTVVLKAGTYTEAISMVGLQTVTVVGPTASSYAQNQVAISAPAGSVGVVSVPTNHKGATFRNLNLTNTASTTSWSPAAYVRSSKVAFYGCSLVSHSLGVIYGSYGTTLIANSYIEGTDRLFANFPTVYVYGSTIAPTALNAFIVYGKGLVSNGVNYNSTVVIDSSSVIQKPGTSNTGVVLATPNGNYTNAIYRNTSLPSNIAASGVWSQSCTLINIFGEYQTTGIGAYSSANAAARVKACDVQLSASQVSSFNIEQVFGNAYVGYSSFDVSWIDSSVLEAIQNSNSAQIAVGTSKSVTSPVTSPFASSSSSSVASSPSSSSSAAISSASSSSSLFLTFSTSVSVDVSGVSSSTSAAGSTSASSSSASASADVAGSSSASSNSSVSSIATSSTSTAASSSTCGTPNPSATLIVSQTETGCGFYNNISSAVAAIPADKKAYTIYIKAGTYTEQLSINRQGKVILIGETSFKNDYSQNSVKVQFSRGELTSAGRNEETPVIYAKKSNDNTGMAIYNIDFINTYPQTVDTAALAADFYGANINAYGCSFIGFQDTLLANQGTQVFSNCYVEGSVDFVWGFGTAYFYQSVIASNTKGSCNAAQGRKLGTTTAYIFDSCYVTYTSTYGETFGATYLGRPYSSYSTVVYKNSYIDKHINAAGWQVWSKSNPQTSNVMLGEYNNTGPSSWSSGRVSFSTNLTDDQAAAYTLSSWVDVSAVDMTAYNYVPSWSFPVSGTSSAPSGPSSSASGTASGTASASALATSIGLITTASVNAHPDSGTVPSQYAVTVSARGADNAAFTSLTAALESLPKDNTNQTIFLYPGSYVEQVPSINRPGAVRIVGYTPAAPGKSYKDNQVTVTFSRGLSISPRPSGSSNADTAVIATASNKISFYNVNFINTDNLDGLTDNYVTLAASIYGNNIAFYACSFEGWQDTLLTGATSGYQYYESCYINGAIDFIWGYSKAYFKGCTIGAKRAKSCVTAQSRSSTSAVGGYIFDQCLFTSAHDATTDLTGSVYLGRPYSAYALVVVKNSYLDATVHPSGWKIWSATDPRTDHITFAEYANTGPGNWENNAAARQAFGKATLLTSDTYPLASVMDSTSWIDMTYFNSIVTPQPAVVNTTSPVTPPVVGSSAYNGTTPPAGALIVSKIAINDVTTYGTIQEALNAAPTSSKTNATIFIYPGVYEEQLIVAKSGTTIFMGYSDSTDDYSKNQVIIQQSRGIDTQGDGSNVDGATVYATGNYFYAYNINFRNNNGTQQNIASLGFAVKSSKYAFLHGCQVYGNQDTLYINGFMFAFKTYIEGNVDFIFGSGSGYFLDSTIAPNEDGVAISASKRTTNTTQAGFVFDQCSLVPAAGTSGFKNVSLGRPWNNNARVLYVGCYLDSMIGRAGWTQWSKSTPNTDGVVFTEYRNNGPGSNTCDRAGFSKQLTESEVTQFQLSSFFTTTSWIDFSVVDTQPFTPSIDSAPAACASSTVSSSTVLPSSTSSRTSSTLSSSSLTSSTLLSSSTPLVTATVTTTVITRVTASTTVTNADITSTSVIYVTQDNGLTVTPEPVLRTSSVRATIIIVATTTRAGRTTTSRSTEVVLSTATVSARVSTIRSTSIVSTTTTVSGRDTTIRSTETNYFTTSVAGRTSTVRATSTVSIASTSTPRAVSTTTNLGGVVTVYSTSTPRASTVTSTTTIQAADVTSSTTIRRSTITQSFTSIKTTTRVVTTTATCVPLAAARLFRRGLEARAAGTTTIRVSATQTSYVTTSTITSAGLTAYTSVTSTTTIGSTTTLRAATSTTVITALATSTSFVTESAASVTAVSTVLSTSVTTQTIAADVLTSLAYSTSTATVSIPGNTVTSVATVSSVQTISAAAVTSTSYRLVSTTTVVTAERAIVTVTNSADSTTTIITTLPTSSATVWRTSSIRGSTSYVTVTPAASTKSTTIKISSTVFTTTSRTSQGAIACTT